MKTTRLLIANALLLFLIAGCTKQVEEASLSVDFTKYELENGLDVILHQDHSDPIVALAVLYHVGSNSEKTGSTGFAHLFEHMLFQKSENVGEDQFFKIVQDAGGTLNGGTWNDGTYTMRLSRRAPWKQLCGLNRTEWASSKIPLPMLR
jgi:zinc protease